MTTRYVLAIDPGLLTGICLFSIEEEAEPVKIWSKEITMEEFAPTVRKTFEEHPNVEVVCERFVITIETAKKAQAPYSLELIGVLKQCLRDVGQDPATAITFQKPADAMNLFTNEKIKKLEYWHRGGKGHALDSIRHALLYLATKGRWKPVRMLSS